MYLCYPLFSIVLASTFVYCHFILLSDFYFFSQIELANLCHFLEYVFKIVLLRTQEHEKM